MCLVSGVPPGRVCGQSRTRLTEADGTASVVAWQATCVMKDAMMCCRAWCRYHVGVLCNCATLLRLSRHNVRVMSLWRKVMATGPVTELALVLVSSMIQNIQNSSK